MLIFPTPRKNFLFNPAVRYIPKRQHCDSTYTRTVVLVVRLVGWRVNCVCVCASGELQNDDTAHRTYARTHSDAHATAIINYVIKSTLEFFTRSHRADLKPKINMPVWPIQHPTRRFLRILCSTSRPRLPPVYRTQTQPLARHASGRMSEKDAH